MAKKQQESAKTEEAALIEKVDAMMDTKRPESAAPAPADKPVSQSPPPLDIFKDAKPPVAVVAEPAQTEAAKTAPPLPVKPAAKPASPPKAEVKTDVAEVNETISPETPAAPAAPAEPVIDTDELADPLPDQTVIDGSENDRAVDDIVAHEADTILAVEDAKLEQVAAKSAAVKPRHHRLRGFMTLLMVVFMTGIILVIYLTVSSIL